MKKIVRSRVSDEDLRKKVNELSDKDKEFIIEKLEISHSVFQNWLDEKGKLVNSKKKNQLINMLF